MQARPATPTTVVGRSGRRWPNRKYNWIPRIAEADIRAPTELDDPARSFPSLPHLRTRRFAPRDQRTQDEIPEGRLRDATYRRDAIYRRALALADVASAAIAVLIGVPILGDDALNPLALLALPLVLVVGKITGLYDRDEHLIRKTTLDEVPALFWVATLYALLIWLAGDLIVDGQFGRDQAVGVWALLFASMVTIRALARHLAGGLSGEERCLVLGDADTANWITRRFDETPGLKARVVARAPLAPEPRLAASTARTATARTATARTAIGASTAAWSACSPPSRSSERSSRRAARSPMTS